MDAKRSGYYLEKTMCRKIHTSRICVAVRHVLEQFLKMRILEPEDGGGVESQRVRITKK
jgi:hypothetical protein